MRLSIASVLFLFVGALNLIGCSQDKRESKTIPAKDAIYKVSQPSSMGACPEIKGTYICHSENEDFESSFLLVPEQSGQYHFSMQGKTSSPKEALYEHYAYDRGGFILNGKVQDKTEEMNAGLKQSASLNPEAGLEKISSQSSHHKTSYVGNCRQGVVRIQYAFGDLLAVKMDVRKNSDDTLTIHYAKSEDRGPIKRSKAICKLKVN